MSVKQNKSIPATPMSNRPLASEPLDIDRIAQELRIRRALDTSKSRLENFLDHPQSHFRM